MGHLYALYCRQRAGSAHVVTTTRKYKGKVCGTHLLRVAWPTALDDAALERALYPPLPAASRPVPDWPTVHRELKRKGVTLLLLWEVYKADHPQGFHYSWFCQQYRRFAGRVDPMMRQSHRLGTPG